MPSAPTYWDYLQLDRLLHLQGGLEGDEQDMLANELHFIVVHQSFELWFKLLLREVRLARDHLGQPTVDEETIPFVVQHLRRVNTILRHAVAQFEVMETLTPQGFLDFRDKLVPASGFQSFQMREIEILMGLEEAQRLHYGKVDPIRHIQDTAHDTPAGRLAKERIDTVRQERTVLAVLNDWLARTPIQGSRPDDDGDDAVVVGFLEEYLARMREHHGASYERLVSALEVSEPEAMQRRFEATYDAASSWLLATDVQPPEAQARVRRQRAAALFIESYRELPLLSWPRLLIDLIVEMEEQLVLWRHRHARMVERTIGRRVGTGGSGGVDYLDKTGAYRVFRDLWAVRTVLLPRTRLPELRNPDFYAFTAT
ncbi:MAG: tryptophan 2,3-dioxygenase [Myxococcales bacterium]|nr:tryptophan 2,3-dioxygenase [Myxococcales bacterium]